MLLDEECVLLFRYGEERGRIEVFRRYVSKIYSLVRLAWPNLSFKIDRQEIYSRFFKALNNALLSYRFEKVLFQTYFVHALQNELKNLSVKETHRIENGSFRLSDSLPNLDNLGLEDVVPSKELTPLEYSLRMEKYQAIAKKYSLLNEEEKKVLFYRLQGLTYEAIAEKSGLTRKKIRLRLAKN